MPYWSSFWTVVRYGSVMVVAALLPLCPAQAQTRVEQWLILPLFDGCQFTDSNTGSTCYAESWILSKNTGKVYWCTAHDVLPGKQAGPNRSSRVTVACQNSSPGPLSTINAAAAPRRVGSSGTFPDVHSFFSPFWAIDDNSKLAFCSPDLVSGDPDHLVCASTTLP